MVDIVHKLTLVDDMVDLFAHTGHLTILAKLSDDVLVVVTLTEWLVLINLLLRMDDYILETEGTQLVPLVLRCLKGYSVRIIVEGVFNELLSQSLRS